METFLKDYFSLKNYNSRIILRLKDRLNWYANFARAFLASSIRVICEFLRLFKLN